MQDLYSTDAAQDTCSRSRTVVRLSPRKDMSYTRSYIPRIYLPCLAYLDHEQGMDDWSRGVNGVPPKGGRKSKGIEAKQGLTRPNTLVFFHLC